MGKLILQVGLLAAAVVGCQHSTHQATLPSVPTTSDQEFKVKIVDRSGQPAAWARVSCDRLTVPIDTANADGEYSCMVHQNSRYVFMWVEANGYYFFGRIQVSVGPHIIKLEHKQGGDHARNLSPVP